MAGKKSNFPQINFYCDESCYMQKDHSGVMVLSSVYCLDIRVDKLKKGIKKIKEKHNFDATFELKWTKVGRHTIELFKDVVSFLSDEAPYLKVRILFTLDKNKLDFEKKYWYLSYSDWFQRMYYHLLKQPIENVLSDTAFTKYKLFIDKKDSYSNDNTRVLCDVLSNVFAGCNFDYGVYDSKEILLIQIADLFAGATGYKNRKLTDSKYKLDLIKHIEEKFKVNLSSNTSPKRKDFNVFKWGSRNDYCY